MAGFIYCFNTICDTHIYKAGHTQQPDLQSRLKSYLGPSKPRVVVASRRVDDSVVAEGMMLGLMRQCYALKVREDLGDEWFESCKEIPDVMLHKAILLIFDVVSKACRKNGPPPPPLPRRVDQEPPSPTTTLPAMGAYFAALDAFMYRAPPELFADVDGALRAFEAGDACPIYAEYVMWPRATRLAVARNRYT